MGSGPWTDLLILLGVVIAIVLIDRWLDRRSAARDARRRNQAHPWRKR